jgi:hypothetical protein
MNAMAVRVIDLGSVASQAGDGIGAAIAQPDDQYLLIVEQLRSLHQANH